MSDAPYQPIPCAQHEWLEFAALTKQWLDVCVSGETHRLLPLDVYTLDGAEWLKAQTPSGEQWILRLDSLQF